MSVWDYLPLSFSTAAQQQEEVTGKTAEDVADKERPEKKASEGEVVTSEPILVVESRIMEAGGEVDKEAWIELEGTDTPPEATTDLEDQRQWDEWIDTLDTSITVDGEQQSGSGAQEPHTSLTGHSRQPTPPIRSDSPSTGWSVMVGDDRLQQYADTLDIEPLDERGGMRETTREELLRLRKECTDLFEHLKAMKHDTTHDVDAILKEKTQQQAREIHVLKQECAFLYSGLQHFHSTLQASNSESSASLQQAFGATMTQVCVRCSKEYLVNRETACTYHTLPLDDEVWPCCNSSGPHALGCATGRHLGQSYATDVSHPLVE